MTKTRVQDSPLQGRRVAITGRFSSMKREEALAFLDFVGAEFDRTPDVDTDFLVVGEASWLLNDEGRPTASLAAAQRLRAKGLPIEILTETQFLAHLGLDELLRLYTTQQLARILRMKPAEITSWVRRGLVRPVKIVNRLHYFDFGQVASAKFLHDLVERGVPVAQIRESLHAIEIWYPAAGRSLLQLGMMERDGRLLVRLDDGSLADPNGQLYFVFPQSSQTSTPRFSVVELDPDHAAEESEDGPEDEDGVEEDLFGSNPDPSGSWFEIAVEFEESGRLPQAAEAYQHALAVDGPSAEIAFNLGNVLYGLGRREEAVQRFMQAVELDPSYIEAWNNLANALFDIGRREEAVRALRKALAVNPRYADAHYNLAEVLHDLGRMDEACTHWRAYLEQDPSSSWADLVRDRLSDFED